MNAGFIGIGSMGGTLVRALATESHGNLGGRHHVCASSTVPTRSTGCFARSSPRPAWRWGVDSTSQVPNLKKAKSTSSCSPGFAVNFGKFCRRGNVTTRLCEANHGARSTSNCRSPRSPVLRYGLAALSVSVALGAALLLERFHFRNVADPLFLVAIAVTVWYAGIGPAIFAVVLSGLGDTYFFIEPIYSLYITRDDIPHFVIFVLFASLLTGFAAVRRRVERDLVQARDDLQIEVAERTQQASLLNLTHDPIFVRDMSDVITYWNRGAQELYGWTDKEAVGRRSQELLQTIFPTPLEDIRAELLRINRWEGELRKTKADGTQVVVASRWSLRRDEQERPVAILETNNNITEGKRREDEIPRPQPGTCKAFRRARIHQQRNWKRSLILSRMTCVRPFDIWLAIPSCFKRGHLPSSMKRATTIWR